MTRSWRNPLIVFCLLVVVALGLLSLKSSYVLELKAISANHLALLAMETEDFAKALEKFSEALQDAPQYFIHHLNLALSFELLKKEDEALKAYQYTKENSVDEQIQFYALFNEARLLAQMKKLPEALNQYQEALRIDPNSERVKINIELLEQQQKKDQQQQEQDKEKKEQGDQGDKGDQKDPKDEKDPKDKQEEPKENKSYAKPKPQPKKFEGKDLKESDVKKILGELERQEQKIRKEYYKQQVKEQPNAKDW